jgi:hypothetical protein
MAATLHVFPRFLWWVISAARRIFREAPLGAVDV